MPYLYAQAVETSKTGIPMMRAMMLEFDEIACEDLDRQYMLGDALLVAPVFTEDGSVDVYLPEGTWTHLLSGEMVTGGKWRKETHDFFSLPLYVRQDTILPIGANENETVYDYSDGLTLKVYNIQDGSRIIRSVCGADGIEILKATAVREGNDIKMTLSGKADKVRVEQVGSSCEIQIQRENA